DGEDLLLDARAVDGGVADAAAVPVAMARLARVGEPDAAGGVDHQVVGPADVAPVYPVVQDFDLAGLDIDAFDASGAVVLRRAAGDPAAILALPESEAAVVGDVAIPVGPHRRAIGAAAQFGHDVLAAVRENARQGLAPDLHHQQAAIAHPHRTFRKPQIFSHYSHANSLCSLIVSPIAVTRPAVAARAACA